LAEELKEKRAQETIAWVTAHGSDRLKKAAEMKLLSQSLGAYRSERLAHEMASVGLDSFCWEYLGTRSTTEVLNPSLYALEQYAEVLAHYPDAKLERVDVESDGDDPVWVTVVVVELAWCSRKVFAELSNT
jgi:hypothetical protein